VIWIALALSLAVAAILILPVLRRGQPPANRAAYDLTVFQDQLKEVDRDVARGVLTESEAGAARLEIQRRILAVGRAPAEEITAGTGGRLRWVGVGITAIVVPLIALGAYVQVGTPDPDAARLAAADSESGMSGSDIDALIERLAARVAAEPNNPDGLALLARTYRELGRYSEAADAYRKLAALQPSAEAYSQLGEALIGERNGQVPPDAHAALVRALELDRTDPRARFLLGLEQAGQGNQRNAIAIWRDLTTNAPADAPWLDAVREQLAALAQEANIPPMSVEPKHPLDLLPQGERAVAAAEAAPPSAPAAPSAAAQGVEQNEMIKGMVAGLAARLAQNPEDYDGWLMLGRSYMVLQDPDKAADAYKKAIALRPKEVTPRLQYAGLLMGAVDVNATTPLPAELTTTIGEILKLAPEQPEALYLAGLSRARGGDSAGARNFWQRAQKASPEGSALRGEIDRRLESLK